MNSLFSIMLAASAGLGLQDVPVKIPPGMHAHATVNGTIIHSDSNYGSAAAHAGVIGAGWPKTGYAGQTVMVRDKSKEKIRTKSVGTYATGGALCPTGSSTIVGYVVQPAAVRTVTQGPPVTTVEKQAPITIQPPDIVKTVYPPPVVTETQAPSYTVPVSVGLAPAVPVAVGLAPRGRAHLLCPASWGARTRTICP